MGFSVFHIYNVFHNALWYNTRTHESFAIVPTAAAIPAFLLLQ